MRNMSTRDEGHDECYVFESAVEYYYYYKYIIIKVCIYLSYAATQMQSGCMFLFLFSDIVGCFQLLVGS